MDYLSDLWLENRWELVFLDLTFECADGFLIEMKVYFIYLQQNFLPTTSGRVNQTFLQPESSFGSLWQQNLGRAPFSCSKGRQFEFKQQCWPGLQLAPKTRILLLAALQLSGSLRSRAWREAPRMAKAPFNLEHNKYIKRARSTLYQCSRRRFA
jgi:hypothetical protein